MEMAKAWQPQLECDGCQLIESVLSSAQIGVAVSRIEKLLQSSAPGILSSRGVPYGARNLLELWPDVVELARSAGLARMVIDNVGPRAAVVRGLLFDKPPTRSWTLPWHRDRTIAVQDVNLNQVPCGFSAPTRKAGTLHLSAPDDLLRHMLTLRFSLDPMTQENGQLVVLPGSHQTVPDSPADSDLTCVAAEGSEEGRAGQIQQVNCRSGDVFVMRPLLAHSSNKSSSFTQMHRRVIHLELCDPQRLPPPLQWKHALPIFKPPLHGPS